MAKYIFITGGVCSGLGKGITGASIGMLLKASGYTVAVQKLDPYLNVDPGTMNPYQHGEVFVTKDGAETDLDLGHYERFIDEEFTSLSSTSTGQIYKAVLDKEREGMYLGKTIQIIPHITNAIKGAIHACAERSGADIMIVEIGGTVGDIEAEPYLEAARQMHNEEGHHNVLFVHLVLLPYLKSTGEVKTKPAQASVRELRRIGINADVIMCRYDDDVIEQEHLDKIALFCDVVPDAVIPAPTVDTIYQVPLNFNERHVTRLIARHFQMDERTPDTTAWEAFVNKIHSDLPIVDIALVGKYNGLKDSYLSVMEAVKAAGYFNNVRTRLIWIDSERIENDDPSTGKEWAELKKAKGIVVMGGFGKRGTEGKIAVAKYARENNIPYLGLCLGMQIAAIEFARNVLSLAGANSVEFDEQAPHPIIALMEEQKKVHAKGATMRLGNYACNVSKDSKSFVAYGTELIQERHRHRYEFNSAYTEQFEQAGMKISGINPESGLCEILENTKHPWFVGVQFHPEFKSRPLTPHPLFRDFIKASL